MSVTFKGRIIVFFILFKKLFTIESYDFSEALGSSSFSLLLLYFSLALIIISEHKFACA